ncbi:MAG: DUF4230 domain-containing protein [Treponema sp.]|nr:DUF4230 domain-containing protein [Treponema sp.]
MRNQNENFRNENKIRKTKRKIHRKISGKIEENENQGFFSRKINKILWKIILILILAALPGLCGFYGFKKFSEIKTEKRIALAAAEMQKCAELISVKNYYSDIVSIKKSRIAGLAKSFSIVRYEGILRAGIADLSLCDVKISQNGKKVEIVIPECEVLGNDISGIEVFDEDRSIFVSVTMKEMIDEINLSRESSKEKLIEAGILEEARQQAIMIIKNIFRAAGFSDVRVG